MKSMFLFALLFLTPVMATGASSERPTGSVAQAQGNQLRVCFNKDAAPAVGTLLEVRRGFVPYKGTGAMAYSTVGHARVVAAEETACVTAEVVSGRAKRFDRVRIGEPCLP